LEKCSIEKCQPYQTKPVVVETVDPNRTPAKRHLASLEKYAIMTNLPLRSGTLWTQAVVVFILFSFGSECDNE